MPIKSTCSTFIGIFINSLVWSLNLWDMYSPWALAKFSSNRSIDLVLPSTFTSTGSWTIFLTISYHQILPVYIFVSPHFIQWNYYLSIFFFWVSCRFFSSTYNCSTHNEIWSHSASLNSWLEPSCQTLLSLFKRLYKNSCPSGFPIQKNYFLGSYK